MSEYIYTTEGTFGLRECTGEEIVRCRDCKYYMHSSWHRCDLHSIAHEVEPDGFCKWGEKKVVS